MEQFIKRKLNYNKSLKIDEAALKELDSLYKIIEATAGYSIITEGNMHYNFDNLEEVLQYNFSDEIKIFKIYGKNYTLRGNLDIVFEIDYMGLFTTYCTIAEISYSTSNENIDILLNKKIADFYKRYTTNKWIIGKFGILGYSYIFIILMLVVVMVNAIINNINISTSITMNSFFVAIVFSAIFNLIRKFDIFICKKFFKPILYYINKQKDRWDKIERIKSNIFWGVIVAIIVGIITTVICNKMF